jgi:hypothetical protein
VAMAQAAGGFLVATVSPPPLIYTMRVGPSYYLRIRSRGGKKFILISR